MSGNDVPDASGAFTRALRAVFDTEGRFGHLVGTVRDTGISVIPDDWVPWLIYDLGLEDVVPYVRTFRQALAEGPAWQRARGTPEGIRIGIGWVESAGEVAPPDGRHNWWEFQVGFTNPAQDIRQIRQLDGIIALSAAAEDELFRMFSPDYDLRPVRMDEHGFDDGWMDDYSGAPRWEDGPSISFGRDETGIADLDPIVIGTANLEATGISDWFDGMQFDQDRFEDRPSAIWETAADSDGTHLRFTEGDDTWPEVWPVGPWTSLGAPFVFIAQSRRDDATLMAAYDDDTWSNAPAPTASWRDAGSSKPIPISSELS